MANTGVIVSQAVVDQFGDFKLSKNKTTFLPKSFVLIVPL
jgi:hypothetical protein